MKIGGHISTAGGVLKVFDRAQAIGANCFQIFTSSPRMWAVKDIEPEVSKKFRKQLDKQNFSPSFVHIKYLVNLSSPNPEVIKKSLITVKKELNIASQLGLAGAMFHIGSLKDSDRSQGVRLVVQGIKEILEDTACGAKLLLENAASSKKIGYSLSEIGNILDKINNPRLGVCLDTAHSFAAEHDLSKVEGVNKWAEDIEKYIGIENLQLIHLNDSKAEFGSGRDLHQNLTKGNIGETGIRAIINHPKLHNLPFILEVPGFDKKGPDKINIDIFKKLYLQ